MAAAEPASAPRRSTASREPAAVGVAVALLLAAALPASATITTYRATGDVRLASLGVGVVDGDTFELFFAIDDSLPQTGFSGPMSASYEDALVDVSLTFSNGRELAIDAALYSAGSSSSHLIVAFGDSTSPGFRTTLPTGYFDPPSNEFFVFDRFQLVLTDPSASTFSNAPPEIAAPDPAAIDLDFFSSQVLITWMDPDGTGNGGVAQLQFDGLEIVPEPGTGLLAWLGFALLARSRRATRSS